MNAQALVNDRQAVAAHSACACRMEHGAAHGARKIEHFVIGLDSRTGQVLRFDELLQVPVSEQTPAQPQSSNDRPLIDVDRQIVSCAMVFRAAPRFERASITVELARTIQERFALA